MRWKLLISASLVAALASLGLWSSLAIGLFGSARVLARNDLWLLGSAIIPLTLAGYAGVFVYRHTSRSRKTQAVSAAMLALLFTLGTYLVSASVLPGRLMIPRTSEVRHTR